MRLHRLRLKDFRGIEERDIEFADSGITVVEGANEAGKSSMIEALDLLLGVKDDSKGAGVRAVKPAGRDVGSEVCAEISCGPWRFEYFKRFNRKTETRLTILKPKREQLTGRGAHERVTAILNESLDDTLFRALRLLQTAGPDLGDLADSAALTRALDRVAAPTVGSALDDAAGADDGAGAALIEAVEGEFTRYFTATGRPARELADATAAAKSARAAVDAAAELMRAADQAAAELPAVELEHARVATDHAYATADFEDLGRRLAEAEKVEARLAEGRARAGEWRLKADLAERDLVERTAAAARIAVREKRIETEATQAAEAAAGATRAAAEATELDEAVGLARVAQQALRAELAVAEAAEQLATRRARLATIDQLLDDVRGLDARSAELAPMIQANPVVSQDVSMANDLDRKITSILARIDAAAATVEVLPTGDEPVTLDGVAVTEARTVAAVGEMVIEAAGVRVVVRGAVDTQSLAEQLSELQTQAARHLARCGVAELMQIAGRAQERADLERERAGLAAARTRVLAGAGVEALAAERGLLVAELAGTGESGECRPVADLVAEDRRRADFMSRSELAAVRQRQLADGLRTRAEEKAAAVTAERAAATAERSTLVEERARVSDAALAGIVAGTESECAQAQSLVTEREKEAAAVDPAGVQARYAEAAQNVDRLAATLKQLWDKRTQLRTKLDMCRDENRLDDIAITEKAALAAAAELARVRERADGAKLLYETLIAKQAESRARYVAPFTRSLEELAAPVFGDSVRFEVADDFTIASRTLDGTTVDVAALSGGAREQLGLIARLACAKIVDETDGVPVILDDALGYSDPERLASMTRVLAEAAGDAQIIVLTCTPGRYAAVDGAHVVAV
ncbi:MAG: AAA family ATPase [Gordonia sp. (in: high G+C Gram-positive bacteria)]|uniref:AAA family ATPase n=1 Tax=Gordonia sp. (in: high G+C Gram-positive bacteria) TaxID=84139 RepID=UPI003BB56DA0